MQEQILEAIKDFYNLRILAHVDKPHYGLPLAAVGVSILFAGFIVLPLLCLAHGFLLSFLSSQDTAEATSFSIKKIFGNSSLSPLIGVAAGLLGCIATLISLRIGIVVFCYKTGQWIGTWITGKEDTDLFILLFSAPPAAVGLFLPKVVLIVFSAHVGSFMIAIGGDSVLQAGLLQAFDLYLKHMKAQSLEDLLQEEMHIFYFITASLFVVGLAVQLFLWIKRNKKRKKTEKGRKWTMRRLFLSLLCL